MPSVRIKRGTHRQLTDAALGNQLQAGEPYWMTDAGALAVGTGPRDFTRMMPHPALREAGCVLPIGNINTTIQTLGFNTTAVGTVTGRSMSTTANFYQSRRRLGYVSAATAGNSVLHREFQPRFFPGTDARSGGYTVDMLFGISDAVYVNGSRLFVGLISNAAAIGNVQPSSLTNIIGVGADAGETTLSWMFNDASGTATKIGLGANFPANTINTDAYWLNVTCPAGGHPVMTLIRRNTGHATSIDLISQADKPSATTLLAMQMWRNNGATAAAVGLDIFGWYAEMNHALFE